MRGLLLLMWLAGCGPVLIPVRRASVSPDVTVSIQAVKHMRARGPGGMFFRTVVENRSDTPIIVDRDAVVLQTPSGPRQRLPGGISRYYLLAPGERHRVQCLYWVADLKPDDRPQLDFSHAITRMGTVAVPVEPIPLTVR
jgi:hypothetical protein